jgi:hypothetical protein
MIFGRFPEESEAAAAAPQNRPERRPYDKPLVPNRINSEEDKERVKGR